jgi:putative SbcD/Mre11-related phosphoesterase
LTTLKPLIPYPALLLEEDCNKTVIVADLHIGWEVHLVEKGIHIPSQTSRLQNRLLEIIEQVNPDRVIIVGDVKQAVPKLSYLEWKEVPEFFDSILKVVDDVVVSLGNHDGDLEPLTPRSIKIVPSSGFVVGKVGLFHGHAWPSPEVITSDLLVMGHIHPVVWFRDKIGLWTTRRVWINMRYDEEKLVQNYLKYQNIKGGEDSKKRFKDKFGMDIKNLNLVVLPAFNDLVGGFSLNSKNRGYRGPFFGYPEIDVKNSEIYLLDGTYIGTIERLQNQGKSNRE